MWLLFFCLEGHNNCLFSAQPLSESVAVCINRALVQQGLIQRLKRKGSSTAYMVISLLVKQELS